MGAKKQACNCRICDNSLWREQATAARQDSGQDTAMEMFGRRNSVRRHDRPGTNSRQNRMHKTRDSVGNIYDAVAID